MKKVTILVLLCFLAISCNPDKDPVPVSVFKIDCARSTNTGKLISGIESPIESRNVTSSFSYEGGDGTLHGPQIISSAGVDGLTAFLRAGYFNEGPGELIYYISGTPSAAGTASFLINIGGSSCILTREVEEAVITSIDCAGVTNTGKLISGIEATKSSNVTFSISYEGGKGYKYDAQTIRSEQVIGLTATLEEGFFATGAGKLIYSITGTPSAAGTATFAIKIGGKTCTVSREVEEGENRYLKLHENGVTIVALPAAQVGKSYPFKGKEYFIAGNNNIKAKAIYELLCTTYVTDMKKIFSTSSFNKDITSWDTSNVTDMSYMFYYCLKFNQDISKWDTSNVTNMSSMFTSAHAFNQPLNDWDVSSVTDMAYMFNNTKAFNQPLNDWDTSNVTRMNVMFDDAEAFNQDLSNWTVLNVTVCDGFSKGATNYTKRKPDFKSCYPN